MKTITPDVEVLWATPDPEKWVAYAASQTMKECPEIGNTDSLIEFLYRAEHRSVFEHVSMSIRLTGVSRAFMAQITRHRLASFTCSSQHYQDYRNYPVVQNAYTERMQMAIEDAIEAYKEAVNTGVPKHVARMCLPEGMTVNMIMTANAREWAEIMHQRLCRRNTTETYIVCKEIFHKLFDWFPELFRFVGAQCREHSCLQGSMRCSK